jgi:hypothetical protein
MAKHRKGLDKRSRDKDGLIHEKRGDTLVRSLRKSYGENFAPGVRGDMKLETLLSREKASSLSELIKRQSKMVKFEVVLPKVRSFASSRQIKQAVRTVTGKAFLSK